MKKLLAVFLSISLVVLNSIQIYPYVGSHPTANLGCDPGDCHPSGDSTVKTSPDTQNNLCLSCHIGGARASNLAFYSVDQATITPEGIRGANHRWDALAYYELIASTPGIVKQSGLGPPKRLWIYAKVFRKNPADPYRLSCASCHNTLTKDFIRDERQRDEKLCPDCHGVMVSTTTASVYTGKKQHHPSFAYGSTYVGCSSCHTIHGR